MSNFGASVQGKYEKMEKDFCAAFLHIFPFGSGT